MNNPVCEQTVFCSFWQVQKYLWTSYMECPLVFPVRLRDHDEVQSEATRQEYPREGQGSLSLQRWENGGGSQGQRWVPEHRGILGQEAWGPSGGWWILLKEIGVAHLQHYEVSIICMLLLKATGLFTARGYFQYFDTTFIFEIHHQLRLNVRIVLNLNWGNYCSFWS